MRVYIGCDNIGYALKEKIVDFIRMEKPEIELIDMGCNSPEDSIAYPIYAKKVCDKIISEKYLSRGILICGTGLGMTIVANKFNGIYATPCHDDYSCERSILSNNANVLCMGAKIIDLKNAREIISKWLDLKFEESPSSAKLELIYELEKQNMKG